MQSLSTFDKRIMIDSAQNLSPEIDLSQKRVLLKEVEDPKVKIITNVIIYSAQYYPATRYLARDTVSMLQNNHSKELYQAFEHLYLCLEREIINGPSSSYIPASQLPAQSKYDASFLLRSNQSDQAALIKAFQELNLQNLIPLRRLKEILWYNCSNFLSMKSSQENKVFLRHFRGQLEIDGQSWTQATPFPSLFVLLEDLLTIIVSSNLSEFDRKFKLMRARLAYLHNKQLKSPVKKLCDIVLTSYKEVLQLLKGQLSMEDYIELLLQYAFVLLFYYKYNQCQKLLRHCSTLLKMEVEFTGRLGRRTKYQVFDTPLLVMQLVHSQGKTKEKVIQENQEQQNNELELVDAKQLVANERGAPKAATKLDNVETSTFDDESILLEIPKFVEGEPQEQSKVLKEVNQRHLLVALGILYFEWRSTPHDEMLMQSISAAVSALLNYKVQSSFSFNFALLLLRSLNQFPRIKNAERALDQLQKLKLSFNGKINKDTVDLYATPYETYLGFILIMAEKYMELGLSIAAVELFQQVGLYEECIDGLIAKNYKQKALQISKRLIEEKGKNPRLLCMLGDIYKDKEIHYYEEAWELSKGTCARAQRSLGWFYFGKNDFQKAIQSFTKATKASYYHPNTWFTLGCTYMRVNQFDKALKSFSQCISIDETQGEAWGNMASCYMYQKRFKEAYSTLSQAVKYSEGNWKLWANLLSVSLSIKQFYKYFQSIQKVTILNHSEILTEEVFKKVAQVMRYQIQIPGRKRVLYTYKNRIDRLFSLLEEKVGQNPLVWRGKTLYFIQLLEYFKTVGAHYSQLHSQNKVDINDLIPGYQTFESTTQETQTGIQKVKAQVVDFKQCELNMTMRLGWDGDKIQCNKVKNVLQEYIQIYKEFSSREDKQDFRLFVEGVTQKISECMEEPLKFGLDWL